MTSFKNKITNRKRKNSKTRTPTTENVDSAETDLASKSKQNEEKQKQTKSGKNRGKNRSKKDVTNNTGAVKSETQTVKDTISCGAVKSDLETPDVVLRNPTNVKRTNSNNSIKRYSDSIVIDNDNGQIKLREENDVVPPILTRAVSGFFIIDQAKKARRLSDLFRSSSTMKLSMSTENLNQKNSITPEKANTTKNDKKNSKIVQQNIVNSNKADAKTKRNAKNDTSSKLTSNNSFKENTSSTSSNSYLKRVRSKIYKTKSEQSIDEVDATSKSRKLKPKKSIEMNSRIPEDEVAVLTPNGVRKSISNFDFRLTRQTSNLEFVRPKTMDGDVKVEKPALAKAKSSSAINLSLLRTRRDKILEKVASRLGAKDVQNEFDFIAFGSVNNVPGLVNSDRLFGSQTSLQKHPSWLHIHKEEQGNFYSLFFIFYVL